jgi:hypothetical protein
MWQYHSRVSSTVRTVSPYSVSLVSTVESREEQIRAPKIRVTRPLGTILNKQIS